MVVDYADTVSVYSQQPRRHGVCVVNDDGDNVFLTLINLAPVCALCIYDTNIGAHMEGLGGGGGGGGSIFLETNVKRKSNPLPF